MKALRHLGGYLAATRTHGIVINPHGPLQVTAFCDAAHGIHKDTRGHGGTVILLAKTPVCASSRKLTILTGSSTAAETLQIANAIPEVIAARELLESTGAVVPTSILNVDCKPAITTCVNGFGKVAHKRALAIRVAAVKAELVEKTVALHWIDDPHQIADVLTKVITSPAELERKRESLHVFDVERVQSTGTLPAALAGRGGVLE